MLFARNYIRGGTARKYSLPGGGCKLLPRIIPGKKRGIERTSSQDMKRANLQQGRDKLVETNYSIFGNS